MRFFFIGPRILGIRPGISFGPSDFRKAFAPNASRSNMTGSFVYVIRGDHNLVKVGVSTNPNARLAQLRSAQRRIRHLRFVAAVELLPKR